MIQERDPRWTQYLHDCSVCGEDHFAPPRGWSSKACIAALRVRCQVLENDVRRAEARRLQNRRDTTELADLRVVVRDQRNHIKNLEAQLLPLIADHEPETEAML